jgi:IstB-like ATP binding protein
MVWDPPLSKTGAELLFEVFSRRYERSSMLVTSNLPSDEWTKAFGSERLTGALLDQLAHHVPHPGDEWRQPPIGRQQTELAPKPRSLRRPGATRGADLRDRLPLRRPVIPQSKDLTTPRNWSTFPPPRWSSVVTPP